MNRRLPYLLLLAIVLLAACAGSETEPRVLEVPSSSPSSKVAHAGNGQDGSSDGGSSKNKRGRSNGDGTGGPDDASGAKDEGVAGSTGGAEGNGSDEDGADEGSSDGATSDGASELALFPAPGDYTYSQSGYREFCNGTCDREDLPDRQVIRSSTRTRSAEGAVVVNEQSSDEGSVRMVTRYEDRAASVLEVYTRLAYRGFEFERTYRPDPPVLQFDADLSVGRHWQGSWRGDVSGDYEAAVVARESVAAAGGTISTLKVFTVTNFRGEFRGRSDITAWLDPETLAVVKTKGLVDLDSDFGSYRTKFTTQLVSAPAYR
jgi:hypothetical protein